MAMTRPSLPPIVPPSLAAAESARQRQARLTKPAGSLGRLEDLSCRLAAIRDGFDEPLGAAALAIFAADHGVAAAGVSAYPSSVTRQMVANFARGGAAATVLARSQALDVTVVDVGVAGTEPPPAGVLDRRIAPGTANLAQGPAMTDSQAGRAVSVGLELAAELAPRAEILIAGDMGIGNTTASAALVCALLSADPERVAGFGTGIDATGRERKVAVIRGALGLAPVDPADAWGCLARFGGFEIGAMAGFIIGGAAARRIVILDGFIAGAAALLAERLSPGCSAYCIASHRSAETGHAVVLDALGLCPLLELDLRLGEGSGALLALPLVRATWSLLREMATFDDAGVDRRSAG